MEELNLFEKDYDGESIVDLMRDISEAFDSIYNPPYATIPTDKWGIQQGTFRVTVEWSKHGLY